MKCSKFYGYFVLLFVLLLSTCPIVKADTELINLDIAQQIIDNAKGKYDVNSWEYNSFNQSHAQNITNALNNQNVAQNLVSFFNNNIKDLILNNNNNINKDNLSVVSYVDGWNNKLTLAFIISKGNSSLNISYNYIKNTTNNIMFWRQSSDAWYRYAIYLENDGTFTNLNTNLSSTEINLVKLNNYEITIENNIMNFPNYLSFTQNQVNYIGEQPANSTQVYNGNYYQTTPEIENTDQSEYGYLWSPAYSGETRVNLLYNGNSNIDCDYYIGNELSHTYDFYYYSGDTKVSVNDYISIYTTQTTSGEWYKHYIKNAGKEHLPNNTHFFLDVYASLGNQTATVVQNFSAFYTVEEIIPTPTPIPTATPTPTPTPDIGTISGQINDINNNITNSTQTIVEQISGDAQKITESIEEVQEFLSEEIESNKSGEIENALNVQIEITDPTADFFTWFFNQIKECFTVTGNQTLTFEILENQITINSDDYIINIPILSTILGTGSGIFIIYGILKDIRREIEKIKEGKFEEIGKEDISADMM